MVAVKYAVLFPGQGSQSLGMGADVRAAYRDLCGEPFTEVLGWDLDSLLDDGTDEALTETQNAQPALYAVSYALWTAFRSVVDQPPIAAAGHSLGEYTALAASGALGYLDGLCLVSARGQAMATAAEREPSGMAAMLGTDLGLAESVVSARSDVGGRLSIANINAPGQIVVAGSLDDLDWLVENAKELGVRRVVKLSVAGAFHSQYMEPAARSLSEALRHVEFADGDFPVSANATAKPTDDPRTTLEKQLTAPVRFSETLERIADNGVDTFVHIGPGDVTAGLVRRTLRGADVRVVSSIEEAGAVAGGLSVQ